MAQLTNTRIYGTLDVDNVITAKNGINVTPLKNSTNTVDNSAKITLNSVIVDDKQDSTKNENKLSSIKLSSEDKSYGQIINVSQISTYIQNNSIFSYTAEIKNNAGKLLSLDLSKIKSEEKYTFDRNMNVKTYNIDKVDTLYNISVNVSDFAKASSSEPEVSYGNVISKYTVDTENDEATGVSGTTNTTKSTVNLQLTVPYEGGEIITDKSLERVDAITKHSVSVQNDYQLQRLFAQNSAFNKYIIGTGSNGLLLKAVIMIASEFAAYPVQFYYKDNTAHMLMFCDSGLVRKDTLIGGEILYLTFSSAEAEEEITKLILNK